MKRVKHKTQSKEVKLTAILIGVFILFGILLGLSPNNPTNPPVTGHATNFISDLFANWSEGSLDINIAKYLFWIILSTLIFGALNFAKFPDSGFLQGLLAIPIAFLFTAYITPSELFTVLTAYTAAGLAMSVIIPFMVLTFFSSMLLSNEKIRSMTVSKIILEVSLWALFCGFLIYKLISGYPGVSLSSGAALIMFIVLGLSLLILFFNRHFRNWVRRIGLEIRRARAEVEHAARDLERDAGERIDEELR
jgi:hypothetical protein